MLFHSAPEELDEVEFTMKLWKEDTEVTSCVDHFFHEQVLCLEIGLKVENALGATCSCFWAAWISAHNREFALPQTTFNQDLRESVKYVGRCPSRDMMRRDMFSTLFSILHNVLYGKTEQLFTKARSKNKDVRACTGPPILPLHSHCLQVVVP